MSNEEVVMRIVLWIVVMFAILGFSLMGCSSVPIGESFHTAQMTATPCGQNSCGKKVIWEDFSNVARSSDHMPLVWNVH